jgi:threonylcarbamoyladenosine tRNA methylthiotransferase MtaB
MTRKSTPGNFAAVIRSAREAIPGVALTTDVIVGFPGETDDEFGESLKFVRSMQFAGGHVFHFSARPGTPAARMKGRVRSEVVKERSLAMRKILAESAAAYQQKFIGETLQVLWEAASTLTDAGWQIEGLTDNYLRVTSIASEPRWNRIDKVFIKEANMGGLKGEIQV